MNRSKAMVLRPLIVAVTLLVILGTAETGSSQSPQKNQLADAARKDLDAFQRLSGEVERGSVTSPAISAIDGLISFRENWWRPGGVAASPDPPSYQPGPLREGYELRARAKLVLKDHNGALGDFALSLLKASEAERRQENNITEAFSKYYDRLFDHIETHRTSAERIADVNVVIARTPNLGVLYWRRAQYQSNAEAAMVDLEIAMRLSPRSAQIYEAALEIHFQQQQREKALAILDRATRELPKILRFHRLRADVLRGDLETDDPKVAVQRLSRVIDECNCERLLLYYYLRERAAANFALKAYDAVIADTNRVIEFDYAVGGKPAGLEDSDDWTYSTQPFHYRASAYLAKLMYREALPDLDALIERNGFAHDFQRRAEVRCKLGDVKGAKADEAKVIEQKMEVKNPCKAK